MFIGFDLKAEKVYSDSVQRGRGMQGLHQDVPFLFFKWNNSATNTTRSLNQAVAVLFLFGNKFPLGERFGILLHQVA